MSLEIINKIDFESWMARSVLNQVYDRLNNRKQIIVTRTAELIDFALLGSPEYISILSARLRTSFGLKDAETALVEIRNALRHSIIIQTSLSHDSVLCKVMALKDDFSEVLSLPTSKYFYEGKAKTLPSGRKLAGGKIEIPWLEWLLFRGDSLIVIDAQIATVKPTPLSRTGNTLMIHPRNPKGWSVPPEFSGTRNNNWLTRTLVPLQESVVDKIWEVING